MLRFRRLLILVLVVVLFYFMIYSITRINDSKIIEEPCVSPVDVCNGVILHAIYHEVTPHVQVCVNGFNFATIPMETLTSHIWMAEVSADKEYLEGPIKTFLMIKKKGIGSHSFDRFMESVAPTSHVLTLVQGFNMQNFDEVAHLGHGLSSSKLSQIDKSEFLYILHNKHLSSSVESLMPQDLQVPFKHCIENDSPPLKIMDGINVPSPQRSECKTNVSCGVGSASVHIYSSSVGSMHHEYCIAGRAVKYKGPKTVSRGLNVIVCDLEWNVKQHHIFDTYESKKETSELLNLLVELPSDHIVLMATVDEANNMLSDDVRNTLISYGSAHISRLQYRGSWVFIGQKNIKGRSLYEKIGIPSTKNSYANSVRISACVESRMKYREWNTVLEDNLEIFCNHHVGFEGEICAAHKKMFHDHESKLPKLTGVGASISILVIPDMGEDYSHVQLFNTLHSIATLPQMSARRVFVALSKNDFISEMKDIIDIFGFNILHFDYKKIQRFKVPLYDAVERFMGTKNEEYVVIIEEEIELNQDFMHYINDTVPLLKKDPSLISVSAWNPNGYQHTSTSSDNLWRVSTFPLPAWVLSRSLWIKIKPIYKTCCMNSSTHWKVNFPGDTLVPGLSRITMRTITDAFSQETLNLQCYRNNRVSSKVYSQPLSITDNIISHSAYLQHLNQEMSSCHHLDAIMSKLPENSCTYIQVSKKDVNATLIALGMCSLNSLSKFENIIPIVKPSLNQKIFLKVQDFRS